MTTLTKPGPLTAADRCDRCGAQAYVQVVLTSGGDLLFCGHHAKIHIDKVRPLAEVIYDFTHVLDEGNTPAASQ
jgi:hypothetical protein